METEVVERFVFESSRVKMSARRPAILTEFFVVFLILSRRMPG
jgi:hypothetical protein